MNGKGNPNPPGWHGRFHGRGLRFTEPRRAILDVLSTTIDHLSAEDIYLAVHSDYPGIGLTTVYRTLELLIEMGLVYRFQFGDGRNRYELIQNAQKPGHHHHLVCINCRKIIDYDDFVDEEVELLKKVEKALSEKYNFQITNHVIQFYGICKDCQGEV